MVRQENARGLAERKNMQAEIDKLRELYNEQSGKRVDAQEKLDRLLAAKPPDLAAAVRRLQKQHALMFAAIRELQGQAITKEFCQDFLGWDVFMDGEPTHRQVLQKVWEIVRDRNEQAKD